MSRIRITSGLRTGKIIEIPLGERCVMGRSKSADVTVADRRMSRTHCVVESTHTGYVLTDLDSANGTWMAGKRVTEVTLKSQDTFKMGNTELLFEDKADYRSLISKIGWALPSLAVPAKYSSVWPPARTRTLTPRSEDRRRPGR